MEKLLDKISEVYYMEDSEYVRKQRERIHWICAAAKGESVLDIGCSQGIASIILGREGKKVLGIDIEDESIAYAREDLAKQSQSVRELVTFEQADLMTRDFKGQTFDCVILSEVLEHLADPRRFLEKAAALLRPDGRAVITVPFGINDFPDHKRTYYFLNILDDIQSAFAAETVEFFGKWIGFTAKRKGAETETIGASPEILSRMESNLYAVEREYITTTNLLKDTNKSIQKELLDTLAALKTTDDRLQEKELRLLELEREKGEWRADALVAKEQLENERIKNAELLDEIVDYMNDLQEEQGLVEELTRKLETAEKRYNNLAASKLGRIMIRYWKFRDGKKKK